MGLVSESTARLLALLPVERLTDSAVSASKLFVSLDAPKATRAPPCFPGSKLDVCPVPRSAAWMPVRWGAYPFEVVERSMRRARKEALRRAKRSGGGADAMAAARRRVAAIRRGEGIDGLEILTEEAGELGY